MGRRKSREIGNILPTLFLYILATCFGISLMSEVILAMNVSCWSTCNITEYNGPFTFPLQRNPTNESLDHGTNCSDAEHLRKVRITDWCRANSILRLVKLIKWKTVVTVYDETTALQAEIVTNMFSSYGLYLVKYDYDSSKTELVDVLTDIYDNLSDGQINVLLMCNTLCVKHVLNMANKFDSIDKRYKSAMNQRSQWLIILLSSSDLTWINWEVMDLDNVAVLLPIDKEDDRINEYHQTSLDVLQTLIWAGEGRKLVYIGDIDDVDFRHIKVFPNIDYGFNGRKFHVATLEWYPFVMKTVADNVSHYTGYCIDVLDDLAKDLNFTYELVEPADQEWGVMKPNGSWTGLVGMMQKGEVDLLAAPLIVEVNRETVMDFTFPIFFDSWTFLMRRPDSDKKWLTPLSWQVLVCVGTSLPVFALILFIAERYNPFFQRNSKKPFHYHELLWYVYGAILAKVCFLGKGLRRFSPSGKILISSWWLFTMVVLATYSGNLVAVLSVTLEEAPFNDFEGLVEQDRYKWGTLGGTIYLTIMEVSENPVLQKMLAGIKRELPNDPSILNFDQDNHVAKVLNEDYVYLGEKSYFEILTRNNCQLVKALEDYPVLNYAVGLPNNSPYTQLFSKMILKMIENGFPEIWKEQNWPKNTFCKDSMRTEANVVTITDLQAAFYLALFGFGLSAVVLILEQFKPLRAMCELKLKNNGNQNKT